MSFTALIDYEMGNLLSVSKALAAVGADVRIVRSPAEAAGAGRLILPGVGNFGDGMSQLNKSGFADFVRGWIASDRPFLGICLGMQMLMESSEEAPGVPGLGVFPGRVIRFPAGSEKVPHMGWNGIRPMPGVPFFEHTPDGAWFYFVHSFYVMPTDASVIGAKCHYMVDFTAALAHGNLLATQFHPEKSQDNGLALLKTFLGRTRE